jgi:hypothetical protein
VVQVHEGRRGRRQGERRRKMRRRGKESQKKMKKIVRLISVAAIAMALIIAFSGVASAIMIGSGVATDFNKNFIKNTGYTSKWNGLTDVLAAYKIDAGGLKEGAMAKGTISAGVSVYVVDGSDGGLGSILSYEEKSTASGSFVFHKVMDYTSVTP